MRVLLAARIGDYAAPFVLRGLRQLGHDVTHAWSCEEKASTGVILEDGHLAPTWPGGPWDLLLSVGAAVGPQELGAIRSVFLDLDEPWQRWEDAASRGFKWRASPHVDADPEHGILSMMGGYDAEMHAPAPPAAVQDLVSVFAGEVAGREDRHFLLDLQREGLVHVIGNGGAPPRFGPDLAALVARARVVLDHTSISTGRRSTCRFYEATAMGCSIGVPIAANAAPPGFIAGQDFIPYRNGEELRVALVDWSRPERAEDRAAMAARCWQRARPWTWSGALAELLAHVKAAAT